MGPGNNDNALTYCDYVILYVDGALCIIQRCKHVLWSEIVNYFYVEEGSVVPPKIYLGNKVSKVIMENGIIARSFSSSQYIQAAVHNVEKYLKERGQSLPEKV